MPPDERRSSGELDFFSDHRGDIVHVTARASDGEVRGELLFDLDAQDAKRVHEELGDAIRRNEHHARERKGGPTS